MIVRFLSVLLLLPVLGAMASECRYSQKELTKIDSDRYSEQVKDWLANDTYGDDWACLMKKRNLKRDTLKNCLPSEETALNFLPETKIHIQGKIKYMGMVPQPYSYELSPDGLVEVRIAFKGELGQDEKALEITRQKLAFANEIWTKHSPGKKLKFNFQMVGPDEDPHFTVKLQTKVKGTKYNSVWGVDDNKFIVAHEVGHMVGLDDEYSVVRTMVWQIKNEVDTRMCNLRSLMCDYYSASAILYPYVYYQIQRRAYCLNK